MIATPYTAMLRAAGLPATLYPPGARIGLLGGSFNPPHEGHRHLSRQAAAHLGLHEVWWLVAPQNPLKPTQGMAPLPTRLADARSAASGLDSVRVTDIEARLGTRYTIDTVRALKRLYPLARFVWVIGADNFIQLPRWRAWKALMAAVPIAVFDRPTYASRALDGAAAGQFAASRMDPRLGRHLADRRAPAWAFFRTALDPSSSTALRARKAESERRMRLEGMASGTAKTRSGP